MAVVGDRIQVPSKRVGQAPREGVITGSSGTLLRVTWSGGEESTISPSMGSVVVVGRVRARATKGTSKVRSSSKAVTKRAAKVTTKKTAKPDAKKAAKTAAKKTIKASAKSKRAGASRSPKRSGRASKRRK